MISFGSAVGNLYNVWGKCGLLVKQSSSNQSSQNTNLVDTTNGIVAQFNSESDIQATIGSSYISQLNSDTMGGFAQVIAEEAANRIVYRDNPQPGQTLTSSNTITSLLEIIRQMKVAGASILSQTVTATITTVSNPGPHFSGFGNGRMVVSIVRPLDGLTLQNTLAETIQVLCISDSYLGGSTAGNELLSISGTGSSGVFDFDWPKGSGLTTTINAIDGSKSNTSGNLMKNSGFDTFTVANTPDSWTLTTATPGTNIFSESTLVYGSGKALRVLGDGSTVIDIRQRFNSSSSGTPGKLDSLGEYSVCLFMRRDAATATGTITVDLIDAGNNVIQDAGGVNNTFTIDLSTLTTSYVGYTGVFRTPIVLPSQQWVRIRTTSPYSNGRSFYIDRIGFGVMSQLGPHAIFASVHSGSTNFVQGDWGTILTTNGRGSAGTLNTFSTLLYRLFNDVQSNELIFPYSTTPTISDNLIS